MFCISPAVLSFGKQPKTHFLKHPFCSHLHEEVMNFHDLPKYVCLHIYSEWFNLKDLACLDSATCHHAFRPQFLLHLVEFTFSNSSDLNWSNKKFLLWYTERKIHFHTIVFNESTFLAKQKINDFLLKEIIGWSSSNLKFLSCNDIINITDDGISHVAKNCPNLCVLSLDYTNIGDRAIKSISDYCINLQLISFKQCPYITLGGIEALSHSVSSKIVSLSADGLKCSVRRTMYGNSEGLREWSLLLIHIGKTITHLSLSGANSSGLLAEIGANCPNLTSLDISRCKQSDAEFKMLVSGCGMLERFVMMNCPFNPSQTIQAIKDHLPNIKSLKFFLVGRDYQTSMQHRFHNNLFLDGCFQLFDSITTLQLDACLTVVEGLPKFNNSGAKIEIGTSSGNKEYMSFYNSLRLFKNHDLWDRLEVLTLEKWQNSPMAWCISDDFIRNVVPLSCSNLRRLTLEHSPCDDLLLKNMLNNNHSLEVLHLDSCHQISCGGLVNAIETIKNSLVSLHIYGMDKFHKITVSHIFHFCGDQLEFVEFMACLQNHNTKERLITSFGPLKRIRKKDVSDHAEVDCPHCCGGALGAGVHG